MLSRIRDLNFAVQLDVLQEHFSKRAVCRDKIVFAHHFVVGPLQEFNGLGRALIGRQG
jgi:hypothetical protein